MGRAVKILVWALVLLGFAAGGAYVASRTDPFPPGVTDPGVRPTASASIEPEPTEVPEPSRWQLTADVRSAHDLHVGGSCRSDWEVQALIHERPDGTVAGEGLATLAGDAGCDFPTADRQTEVVSLMLRGRLAEGLVVLRLRPEQLDPAGSKDLGGLVATLPVTLALVGEPGRAGVSEQLPDGNDGLYRAVWRALLVCVDAC